MDYGGPQYNYEGSDFGILFMETVCEDGDDIRISCYPKQSMDILVPQEATLFFMSISQ